ncbi:hypothetical protein JCM6882_004889 [Rhodosporidiobolus microsporus]
MSRKPSGSLVGGAGSRGGGPSRPSAVARGTAYELAVRSYLLSSPYNCTSLIRIGGAGDAGVDLRGRWGGTPVLPFLGAKEMEDEEAVRRAQRWSVVVQCKAYAKQVGPAVVRELEGVLSAEEQVLLSMLRRPSEAPPSSPNSSPSSSSLPAVPPPTFGFLFSLSGFSTAACVRAFASKLPLSLCHLRPRDPGALDDAARKGSKRGVLQPEELEVLSMSFNNTTRRILQETMKGKEP